MMVSLLRNQGCDISNDRRLGGQIELGANVCRWKTNDPLHFDAHVHDPVPERPEPQHGEHHLPLAATPAAAGIYMQRKHSSPLNAATPRSPRRLLEPVAAPITSRISRTPNTH